MENPVGARRLNVAGVADVVTEYIHDLEVVGGSLHTTYPRFCYAVQR